MFLYFGYGSNINLVSLRAKGVEPISSERAVLRGWSLAFNVQHWFRHEGGVGNIQPSANPNDFVEGMVHSCRDADLASLDSMESYGSGYDRIMVALETANGLVSAQTYVGMPAFLDDSCLPTQRYINIIIKGAEAAGLSQPYIERLRKYPVHNVQGYPEFQHPPGNWPEFNEQTLALNQHYTALAGAVFDMRGARSRLDCLLELFGGKDMTLFYLKRLDSSDGTETIGDIKNGSISESGRKYLNAYLNEYGREYKYAGRYAYGEIPAKANMMK